MNSSGEHVAAASFLLYPFICRTVKGVKGVTYFLKLYFTVIHVMDYMLLCYLRIETVLKSSGISSHTWLKYHFTIYVATLLHVLVLF